MRYANPVVENTSFNREDKVASSSGLGEAERADKETIGSDEKDVDIDTRIQFR